MTKMDASGLQNIATAMDMDLKLLKNGPFRTTTSAARFAPKSFKKFLDLVSFQCRQTRTGQCAWCMT